jgi:hypothetical protein
MDRRHFLKYLSLAGLSFAVPSFPLPSRASGVPHPGPYWITINAAGGWDPSILCDPKGMTSANDPTPVNHYLQSEILEVGAFRCAPLEGNLEFFTRFANDLMIINGIDNGTNSHSVGTRHTWSGSMDPGGPSFAALVASTAETIPSLPYITNGGYGHTASLVVPTRIPNMDAIEAIAYPNYITPNNPDTGVFTEETWNRIQEARRARALRLQANQPLPPLQRAVENFAAAQSSDNELITLLTYLPDTLDNSTNPLLRQAQLALSSFKAGLTVSADLQVGGFDTHGNHDDTHPPRMLQILSAITFIMDEAEAHGIADKLYILVGSDMSRTPYYNDTNGKDHWSVGSMMLMGPGIPGGRVIGGTDATQRALTVSPTSLEFDPDGIRLTPGHVHASLRSLAGIAEHPNSIPFAVSDLLPLFT